MGEKTRQVIEKIGCEEAQARLALAVYDNNAEEAIQHFDTVMSDVCVLKVRIKSIASGVYGLLIVILNIAQRRVIRLGVVLTNNPIVYEVNLDGNWFVFERKIYTTRLGEGWLQNATQEMENMLFRELESDHSKLFFELVGQNKDKESKAFLYNMFSRMQSFPELDIDLVIEYVGAVYHKSKKKSTQHMRSDVREQEETSEKDSQQIDLKVEFLQDSEATFPVTLLLPGDMVLSEVTDDRDVARYISHLLGGVKNERYVPLFSVVEDIQRANKELFIKVRFSPGIAGVANVSYSSFVKLVRSKNIFLRRCKKFFIDIRKKIGYNSKFVR